MVKICNQPEESGLRNTDEKALKTEVWYGCLILEFRCISHKVDIMCKELVVDVKLKK